jgi:7-cyano-7-deazaguanine reductase
MPEFTALCPLGGIESDADELRALRGGAPDFARCTSRMCRATCASAQEPKLYLWSFRDDGISTSAP